MNQRPASSVKEKVAPILLRKGSSTKMPLKEKIVQIYESFFRGEDPSVGNLNFWDELFLLKVNSAFIENEFSKLSADQILALKENINMLFFKSTEVLKDGHAIRTMNALQTLSALIRGVFKKNLGDHGFDVINILMGFDNAEAQMTVLIDALNELISGDHPVGLKTLALRVLLVFVTVTDNVSQNTILEYIMINSVFESIVQILANPVARQSFGHDAVLLLTILVQYRKYESTNQYIVKLSILDDELALNGMSQIVSWSLTEFNRTYQNKATESEGSGFFATLSNMVGSMFVAEEKKVEAIKANDSILLALYEAIHLNRNFITTLTQSHTPSTPATPPDSPTTPTRTGAESPGATLPPGASGSGSPSATDTLDEAALLEPANQPTNLLVTFLTYSSIIIQDIKDEARFNNGKLCLIILTCIAEDQYANSLMHDVNMNFRVLLHKAPMRHRKTTKDKRPASRPLASALIDLMVEFVMSHMMKNFPMELYVRCLGITHRVLCYQKKFRVRLQYTWKDLWTALINLAKFLLSHETSLVKKHDVFFLCCQIVNIFNLFITYGDTFLPNPNSYDELYYEIIRMHQVFDNLYSMALRYTTGEGQFKESALRLTNALVNVRAIINHFSPKVDSWAAINQLSSLTEEQVLEVVRSNYDTLTLKLQDNLDQFPRYEEKPKETAYFTQLVRSIIGDVRKMTAATSVQTQTILQEISTIS